MDVTEKARKLHEEFVKEHGHNPTYVEVAVEWKDWYTVCDETIKLENFDKENTENDPDDREITFYVEGIKGLCKLIEEDVEDFSIKGIRRFFDRLDN